MVKQDERVCAKDYSPSNEEYRSFAPGWQSSTSLSFTSTISNAFAYQSSKELDSWTYIGTHATYEGSGFVYEFRGRLTDIRENLTLLRQLSWIDQQTRAILIQFSLYNPNTEQFTAVTLAAEFLANGGVFGHGRFEPFAFHSKYFGFSSVFHYACAVLYLSLVVYLTVVEISEVVQMKRAYFRLFWSYVQWALIGCSWAGVPISVWTWSEMSKIGEVFRETNGYQFIDLGKVAYVEDVFTSLLGICCFLATIKFLSFSRFHRRLHLLAGTLQNGAVDLFQFTLMFSIVVFAFIGLFHMLFVSKIWSCSSLLLTSEMLFEMLLLKFDTGDLLDAHPILGPLTFFLFIFFVVFIGVTMFVAIITRAFRAARRRLGMAGDDEQVIPFLLFKFKRWMGE